MAVNKVVLHDSETNKDTVLIDVSNDTVSSSTLFKGETAHSKSGSQITGAFDITPELSTQNTRLDAIENALKNKGTGYDTSDATAIASMIFKSETAYTKTGKTTGAFDITPEITAQDAKIAAIKEALKNKGTGIDTSDATATNATVFEGQTYYAKNKKETGSFTITPEITEQNNTITQLGNTLRGRALAPKPEQVKTVNVTANGTVSIKPDSGKVLSEAIARVNIPSSGGEIVNVIIKGSEMHGAAIGIINCDEIDGSFLGMSVGDDQNSIDGDYYTKYPIFIVPYNNTAFEGRVSGKITGAEIYDGAASKLNDGDSGYFPFIIIPTSNVDIKDLIVDI